MNSSKDDNLRFSDFSSFGGFAAFAMSLLSLCLVFAILHFKVNATGLSQIFYGLVCGLVVPISGLVGLFSKLFAYEFNFKDSLLYQEAIWFGVFHGRKRCFDLRKTTKNKMGDNASGDEHLSLIVEGRKITLYDRQLEYIHDRVAECMNQKN